MKISYLGLLLTTHLIPSEKRRKNKLYKIEFRDLMANFVGPNNLIECEVPKYGYKSYCRTFVNPVEALHYFNKNSTNYILVITDCRMPQMSGLNLIKKIKKQIETTE